MNYININAYFDYSLKNSQGCECSIRDLKKALPESLAKIELSKEKTIAVPRPIMKEISLFRETPLFRAKKFEKIIGTSCEIYIKDERQTPSGSHKMNSALFCAFMCSQDGIRRIVTETAGNWGVALAMACKKFNIDLFCLIDRQSDQIRPDHKEVIQQYGAEVVLTGNTDSRSDSGFLSADNAIRFTKNLEEAVYIFGSVYGYFIVPQTIMGIEAKNQMMAMNKYPDIIVGSCGGGANLLGTASAFIMDDFGVSPSPEVVAVEASLCPILSKGKVKVSSIDYVGHYPMIRAYRLGKLPDKRPYIGGLESTIVASAVTHFHEKGLIKSLVCTHDEAQEAAGKFFSSEGSEVAIESAYQLAGVIRKAREEKEKVILVNISSDSLFD